MISFIRAILRVFCFVGFVGILQAQQTTIKGTVVDEKANPLESITVYINNYGATVTNNKGEFFYDGIAVGTHKITLSSIGYKSISKNLIAKEPSQKIRFTLNSSLTSLKDVVIKAKSKATKIEETGYAVQAVETEKIKTQSIEINQVLNGTPGIRVRSTGGTGSDFEYSLDGLSGNAIRFFIDGIPMDYYGSSYSINNIPISLIQRIDIYKGVVPVNLVSDALGGAINLVTKQEQNNFLEASYSFGSFNTHKAVINAQYRSSKTGFTGQLSSYYTYSDNNYKVWGQGVFYGQESTGKAIEFTKSNPAERFNDDFETVTTKLDLGYTKTSWADKLLFSILTSNLKKGIQTGQTMGHVYGERRNNEEVIMPSIIYQKKNFTIKGLDINAFAGYSYTKDIVIDTTSNVYDWRGKIISYNPSGGEVGRSGSSLYTQKDKSVITRLNTSYQLPKDFKLGFNYLYSSTKRTGADPFAKENSTPYQQPQKISTHFAGLSLETLKLDNKLNASIFVKMYGFNSSINQSLYTTEYEIVKHKNSVFNWGAGFAASYKISPEFLLKTSIEQATRLPTATEALGDGVNSTPNFSIKPENSFNINLGISLGKYEFTSNQGLKIDLNTFYRSVSNKLQLNIFGGQELGQYTNIRKIGGAGAELDIAYDLNQKIKFTINGTYLDLKNKQKIDENGNNNITYNDRLRNAPYLMANAGLEYSSQNFIQKNSNLFTYLQSSYVHQFFLRWPSLANSSNKDVVPTQWILNAGIGYTFPSQKFNIALDISNLFNEQVYDNFLLQKTGRAFFFKINYQILEY